MSRDLPMAPRISRMRADEERFFASKLYHDPNVQVQEVCDSCKSQGRRTERRAFKDPLWPVVPVQRWDGIWLHAVCPFCWMRFMAYLKLMGRPFLYLNEVGEALEIMSGKVSE